MKKLVLKTKPAFAIGKIISDGPSNCIYGGRKLVFHRTEKTGAPEELVATRIEVTEHGQYGSLKFDQVEIIDLAE